MSSPVNPSFLQFDGEPVGGRVPAQLLVRGPDLTGAQQAAVGKLYANFCTANQLGLGAYAARTVTLPDGTRVRLESNTGVDRIIVWTGAGGGPRFAIRPLTLFASLSAPFGVQPQASGAPIIAPGMDTTRAVSLWANPPLTTSREPSFQHGARSLWDGADLNNTLPGTLDWYDPRPESPFFGLVLSWWNSAIGRYRRAVTPMLNNLGTLVTLGSERYTAGVSQASIPRQVWCNGLHLATAPRPVAGACLAVNAEGLPVLRVLCMNATWRGSGYLECYEAVIDPEAVADVARSGPVSLALRWTMAGMIATLHQAVHCNASGTRAVLVASLSAGETQFLYEVDLADGTRTVVALPWTPPAWPNQPADPVPPSYAVAFAAHQLLGADYRGEVLEFAYAVWTEDYGIETAGGLSGDELLDITLRPTMGGVNLVEPGTYTASASGSGSEASRAIRSLALVHSALGTLKAYDYGYVANAEWTSSASASLTSAIVEELDEGGARTLYYCDLTGSITGSLTTSHAVNYRALGTHNVTLYGLAGDLRVRSFDVTMIFDDHASQYASTSYSGSLATDGYAQRIAAVGAESSQAGSIINTRSGRLLPQVAVDTRRRELRDTFIGGQLIESRLSLLGSDANTTWASPEASSETTPASYLALQGAYPGLAVPTSSAPRSDNTGNRSHNHLTERKLANGSYATTYQAVMPPPADNPPHTRALCATSSFDQRIYARTALEWTETGPEYAIDTSTSQPALVNLPVDASLLHTSAKFYDPETGAVLADLNAEGNSPAPGALSTCANLLLLGPLKDDQGGRYTDKPQYLRKPENQP